MKETIKPIRGFYHLQIVDDDGTIAGETEGENLITESGWGLFIMNQLAGVSTSASAINAAALGYHSTYNANDVSTTMTNISNQMGARVACAAATVQSSRTIQLCATFTSGFAGSTATINHIGLFGVSSTTNTPAFALATFASSTIAANQAVNMSYSIQFASHA